MATQEEAWELAGSLFAEQKYAVLSTQAETGPYSSLVAFWCAGDQRHIVFPTMRATRKFTYLVSHPRVSLLVDERTDLHLAIDEITAVTATGVAREITDPVARSQAAEAFLAKHGGLADFVASPDCALVRVDMEALFVVTRFRELVELRLPQGR